MILVALFYHYSKFFFLVEREEEDLDDKNIKLRIGSLYQSLNAEDKNIKYYCFAFFLRRILFVALTFALFDFPGIQVLTFIYISVFNVGFLLHFDFYKKKASKYMEIFNECLLLLFCYHVLLIQMTPARAKADNLNGPEIMANSLVAVVILLLVVNVANLVYKVGKHTILVLKKRKANKVRLNRVVIQADNVKK